MLRDKRKRTVIIVAAIVAVILVSVGTMALMQGLQPKKQDPYKSTDTSGSSNSTTDNQPDQQSPSPSQSDSTTKDDNTTNKPALDTSTVGTIDITPMGITASYVKGIGGFEYAVLRTPSGTQYVEFRSPSLVGTKCTDDAGAFASILANPQSDESATLTKTTTIDGTKYGLSLASSTCTSDTAKLKAYQDSFSDAFSLLKKTN